MKELQELISTAIIQNLSIRISIMSLRSIVHNCYPLIEEQECEELLGRLLDELISNKVIRFPDQQAPGAWLEGNKLPRWVSRCCEAPILLDAAKAQKKESVNDDLHAEDVPLSEIRSRAPWEGKMLAIGPSLPLNKVRLHKALIINDYMRQRSPNPEKLPVNERSLALFGHEKELKDAHKGGIFSGRITLEDLDCYRVPEPLQGVRWPNVPIDAPILIIENSTTFYSAWNANKNDPAYSAVVFGRGKMIKGFELATDSLEELREESMSRCGGTQLPQLHYFGDIDPEGIEIPISVNQQRKQYGLSPVLPAYELYRRLLCFPKQPPEHNWPKSLSRADVINWFGEPLAEIIIDAFDHQRRWAQERITQATFASIFAGGC